MLTVERAVADQKDNQGIRRPERRGEPVERGAHILLSRVVAAQQLHLRIVAGGAARSRRQSRHW